MKEDLPEILASFCSLLYKFQFDKAKELIDEFRAKKLSLPSHITSEEAGSWNILLQCLSQLALADKCYMTLSFLLPRGFLRKESPLRSNYTNIRAELHKLSVNSSFKEAASSSQCRSSKNFVLILAEQFSSYVGARIDMMNCYENLSTLNRPNGISIDQGVDIVADIRSKNKGTFHHHIIAPLALSFTYETDILINLLKCNQKLSTFMFMDCLLHFKKAQASLKAWSQESTDGSISKFHQSSSWFNFSSSSKVQSLPSVCIWLKRFYDYVLAKFSLYFYELLSRQTHAQEMRTQFSKLQLNYYQQTVNFHRKQDAANICLLLNVQDLSHFQWRGYSPPNQHHEPLKGLENYPIIFCYPPEKPSYLLPSVVMILTEHAEKLLETERIVPVFDKTKETMFFVTRVENCVFLVLTFNGKRNDRDSHIINFVSELCGELRCAPVFSSLKLAK